MPRWVHAHHFVVEVRLNSLDNLRAVQREGVCYTEGLHSSHMNSACFCRRNLSHEAVCTLRVWMVIGLPEMVHMTTAITHTTSLLAVSMMDGLQTSCVSCQLANCHA